LGQASAASWVAQGSPGDGAASSTRARGREDVQLKFAPRPSLQRKRHANSVGYQPASTLAAHRAARRRHAGTNPSHFGLPIDPPQTATTKKMTTLFILWLIAVFLLALAVVLMTMR